MMGPSISNYVTVDIVDVDWGSILYLHTDTDTCMHMYIDCLLYSKTCLMWPLKKEDHWFSRPIIAYCRSKVLQVKSIAEGSKGSILQSF